MTAVQCFKQLVDAEAHFDFMLRIQIQYYLSVCIQYFIFFVIALNENLKIDFILYYYYALLYSNRIPRNAVIKIFARGAAVCNSFA